MSLKEQIIHEIDQIPESLLEEFLDFILFTKARRQSPPDLEPCQNAPRTDPLADFIGATCSGNLADAIDETLYE
jgi:hypothetical protein